MVAGGFDSGAFNLEMRSLAMDAERASQQEHRHFPYARRVRHGWTQSPEGWKWESEDPDLWEVFCAECGDTDGPSENQTAGVQSLRGPYKSHHHARHVASKHFQAN